MQPPQDDRVGVAIVEHADRYLIGVRGPEAPLAGYAEFPGGKCFPNETPAACAIRETLEETGLRVSILEPFHDCRFEYPHGSVALSFFLCRPEPGESIADHHSGFKWVDAVELSDLKFPPANEPVILRLLDRQSARSSRRDSIG